MTGLPYFGLIVLVAAAGLVLMFASLRKIPVEHRGVLFRFGHLVKELPPGNAWVVPFADQVLLVDLREQTFPLPPDLVLSADRQYAVKGQFTCKVVAAIPAVMAARQAQEDIVKVVADKLVAEIKNMGVAAALDRPAQARQWALEALNEQMSRAWQLKFTKVEFTLAPV